MGVTAKTIRRCFECGRPLPAKAALRPHAADRRLPLPLEHALAVIRRQLVAMQDAPDHPITPRPPPALSPINLPRRTKHRKAS